jgi:hypothetical protein
MSLPPKLASLKLFTKATSSLSASTPMALTLLISSPPMDSILGSLTHLNYPSKTVKSMLNHLAGPNNRT